MMKVSEKAENENQRAERIELKSEFSNFRLNQQTASTINNGTNNDQFELLAMNNGS